MKYPPAPDMHGIPIEIGDLIRRPLLSTQEDRDAIWVVTQIEQYTNFRTGKRECDLTIMPVSDNSIVNGVTDEYLFVVTVVMADKVEVVIEDPQKFIKVLPI